MRVARSYIVRHFVGPSQVQLLTELLQADVEHEQFFDLVFDDHDRFGRH